MGACSFKPGVVAKFNKGKLISAIKGCVDTLNWVISCWDHFMVDKASFAVIEKVENGQPTLKIDSKKFEEAVIGVINNNAQTISALLESYIASGIAQRIVNQINITGGTDSNVVVQKNGTTFIIDVYYT